LPALVTLFLVVIVTFGWQAVHHEREHRLFEDSRRAADLMAARLESHIEARLTIGRNLRLNWAHGGIKGFDDFRSQARSAYELFGDFQAINWIDPAGIIRWVTPLEGNEAARNLNVRNLELPAAALAAAERTGTVQVTPPITLAQGGNGFATYFPLRRDGKPEGFLNIVFRSGPLIVSALRGETGSATTSSLPTATGRSIGRAVPPCCRATRKPRRRCARSVSATGPGRCR